MVRRISTLVVAGASVIGMGNLYYNVNFDSFIISSVSNLDRCKTMGITTAFINQTDVGNRSNNINNDEGEENKPTAGLSFVIGGFPKCGTTSIRHLFEKHNETLVLAKYLTYANGTVVIMPNGTKKKLEYNLRTGEDEDMKPLYEQLQSLPVESREKQIGLKNADVFIHDRILSIKSIMKWNPKGMETKIIIGMRHPVEWFESFYNFRVQNKSGRLKATMPPPESLIGSVENSVAGLHTDYARFERSIMQLGKFDLDKDELLFLGKNKMRTIQTKSKLFFYILDQLKDEDSQRLLLFKQDLKSFMGLNDNFGELPHSNNNRHETFKGKIDICESPRFDKVRKVLVTNGKVTADWIHAKLEKGMDVTIGGKEHFLSLVDTWGSDPCDRRKGSTK